MTAIGYHQLPHDSHLQLGQLMIRFLFLRLCMQTQRSVWNRENRVVSVYKREITSWQGVGMRKKKKIGKRTRDFSTKERRDRGIAWKRAIFQRLEEGERQRKKERDLEKERKNGREEAQGRAKKRYRQIERKRRRQRGRRRIFYSSSLSLSLSLKRYICIYYYILHIYTRIYMNRCKHTPHAYWLTLHLSRHQK